MAGPMISVGFSVTFPKAPAPAPECLTVFYDGCPSITVDGSKLMLADGGIWCKLEEFPEGTIFVGEPDDAGCVEVTVCAEIPADTGANVAAILEFPGYPKCEFGPFGLSSEEGLYVDITDDNGCVSAVELDPDTAGESSPFLTKDDLPRCLEDLGIGGGEPEDNVQVTGDDGNGNGTVFVDGQAVPAVNGNGNPIPPNTSVTVDQSDGDVACLPNGLGRAAFTDGVSDATDPDCRTEVVADGKLLWGPAPHNTWSTRDSQNGATTITNTPIRWNELPTGIGMEVWRTVPLCFTNTDRRSVSVEPMIFVNRWTVLADDGMLFGSAIFARYVVPFVSPEYELDQVIHDTRNGPDGLHHINTAVPSGSVMYTPSQVVPPGGQLCIEVSGWLRAYTTSLGPNDDENGRIYQGFVGNVAVSFDASTIG